MKKQLFDIAVCDDVQTDREETARLTEEICKAEGILPRIARFERAEALLETIQGGERYEIVSLFVAESHRNEGAASELVHAFTPYRSNGSPARLSRDFRK